jgi:hypothetical protein
LALQEGDDKVNEVMKKINTFWNTCTRVCLEQGACAIVPKEYQSQQGEQNFDLFDIIIQMVTQEQSTWYE